MSGQMHPKRTPGRGVLALAAATVAAMGLVVVTRTPATDRVTVVRTPVDAFVVTAAGVGHLAVDGEPLMVGDQLVTGVTAQAGAALAAAGRVILLGRDTALERTAQSSYSLVRGSIVIDRRRGPTLAVRTGDVLVAPIGRGAIRVDRSYDVRVGVFYGAASVLTDAARHLEVSALQQVVVVGTALPGAPTALSLTVGDAREQAVAPELIALDGYLNRLATGLDSSERTIVLPAALSPLTPPGAPRSERTVPLVIAKAAGDDREVAHYSAARIYREEGGSWGVVARLVADESLAALQAAAASVIDATPSGGPTTTFEAGPPPLAGGGAGSTGIPGADGVTATPRPAPGPRPSPTGGTGPPPPSPSPTAPPGVLQQIITTAAGLLPSSSPTVAAPSPTLLGTG